MNEHAKHTEIKQYFHNLLPPQTTSTRKEICPLWQTITIIGQTSVKVKFNTKHADIIRAEGIFNVKKNAEHLLLHFLISILFLSIA